MRQVLSLYDEKPCKIPLSVSLPAEQSVLSVLVRFSYATMIGNMPGSNEIIHDSACAATVLTGWDSIVLQRISCQAAYMHRGS